MLRLVSGVSTSNLFLASQFFIVKPPASKLVGRTNADDTHKGEELGCVHHHLLHLDSWNSIDSIVLVILPYTISDCSQIRVVQTLH
jgi:hypothetical protein